MGLSTRTVVAILLSAGWITHSGHEGLAAQEADGVGRNVRPSSTEASPVEKASHVLQELQGKIRDLRVDALRKRKAELTRLKGIAAEKRALARKLEALRKQVDERQAEHDKKSKELAKLERERQGNVTQAKELVAHVSDFLGKVDKRIDASIPWRIAQRKESVRQALRATQGDSPVPGNAVLAAARVAQEEEALGRLVESQGVKVDVGGKTREVSAFHLGLLGVVYANEEGSVIGFAQAGQKLEDGLKAASSADAAEGYLIAVDILKRRRTPGIVDVFLPKLELKGGE